MGPGQYHTCTIDDGEGGLRVENQQPAGCFIDDSADNTFFQRDVGGLALKMEFYVDDTMAAKVEFHPYDHKLWVYDTLSNKRHHLRRCVSRLRPDLHPRGR